MVEGEKPLLVVTNDKNIFNANNGKRRVWKKKGKSPLQQKEKGKEIMAFEFRLPTILKLQIRLRLPEGSQYRCSSLY